MFYPGETVRLMRELQESSLPKFIEGTVAAAPLPTEGDLRTAEVRFFRNGAAVNVTVPFDEIEPVIEQSLLFRTAVFWMLEGPRDQLVEAAINSMLDNGFTMRNGLNVARLYYDRSDRWWKWGEKTMDTTGAMVVTSASAWDGCVVAFSGRQRFHLEFRLQGRSDAVIFLHEREDAYSEQVSTTEPAMSLARVLMSLFTAISARYCAFPVADPWLQDEDWESLTRPPLYPDLFIFPESELPTGLPGFRGIPLTENRAVWTTLPMKGSPMEITFHRSEAELKLSRLRQLHALGEKYYDQMYESTRGANRCYSNAKDAFSDAIGLAAELEMKEQVEALSKRLEHVKAVFRSQFS